MLDELNVPISEILEDILEMMIAALYRLNDEQDKENLAYMMVNISQRYRVSPVIAQRLVECLFVVNAPLSLIVTAVEIADRRYKERALEMARKAGDLRCTRRLEKMLDRPLTADECRELLTNLVHRPLADNLPEIQFIGQYLALANNTILTRLVYHYFKKHGRRMSFTESEELLSG